MGGGMVGGTLYRSLKNAPLTSNLNIALIDPCHKVKPLRGVDSPPTDLRTVAISPFSKKMFENVGVWSKIEPYAKKYNEMKVWDDIGGSNIDFQDQELGYIVENSVILSSVFDGIESEVLQHQIKQIQLGDQEVTLKSSGEDITTSLLIGSDGTNSFVREFLTFPSLGWNYEQKAFVVTVKTPQAHSVAYQKFLESGPISMLPLGEYSNIVWSTSPDHAAQLMKLSSSDLLQEINNAFQINAPQKWFNHGSSPYPPICIEEIARGSFPLKRLHVTNYVKPRVALIGDAAHTTHPLAGQGVNMGLVDVFVLQRQLQMALESGHDIGSTIILEKYGKQQFVKNEIALNVFEGLKQVYSWNFGPIPFLRSLGVSLVDRFTPLKTLIIDEATGKNIKL